MAALYAVKALLDSGVEFKKRVRFIFGTDDERHFGVVWVDTTS